VRISFGGEYVFNSDDDDVGKNARDIIKVSDSIGTATLAPETVPSITLSSILILAKHPF
jgi:hypothetical protein